MTEPGTKKRPGRPKGSKNTLNATAFAKPTCSPDQPFPAAESSEPLNLETTLPILCSVSVKQSHQLDVCTNQIQHLTSLLEEAAPLGVKAKNEADSKLHFRYLLSTDSDCGKMSELRPLARVKMFQAAGDPWSSIIATTIKKHVWTVIASSREYEDSIYSKEADIAVIFGLSKKCKILRDRYLVVAVGFDINQKKLSNPNDYISEWSRVNGVKIIRAFWKLSHLTLSLAREEDAKLLCRPNQKVYLDGSVGYVK